MSSVGFFMIFANNDVEEAVLVSLKNGHSAMETR